MIKKIFVMLIAVSFMGCASAPKLVYQEPVVRFNDLRVQGIGLNGGAIDVVLNVYNPNKYNLDAVKLSYRLLIDSTVLGEGIYDDRFSVPNGDSTIVHLPVNISAAGLMAAGRQLLGRGSIDYKVAGTLTIDTPLGEYSIPYSRTGRFNNLTGSSNY